MKPGRAGAALLGVVLATAGCGAQDVDKQEFTAKNDAILDGVPRFPGATLQMSFALSDTTGDGGDEEGGPITGYWSTRRYQTFAHEVPDDVLEFYRRKLRQYWSRSGGDSCSDTFTLNHAMLSVNACYPEGFTLSVNHDAYHTELIPR